MASADRISRMAVLTAALLGPSAAAFAQDARTPPSVPPAEEEAGEVEEGEDGDDESEDQGDAREDEPGAERQERAQPLYGVIRQTNEFRDGRSTP